MKKILILLVLISSCKKAEERNCWKFYGDEVEKTVTLDVFHSLEINPNLIVNLIQDTVHYCAIKGGKNVVNLLKKEVLNGKLTLKNENKCAFLRSPKKKITVDVHFVELDRIVYQGSENVKSKGVINGQILTIDLKETSGTLDLELNTTHCYVTAEPSWVNFKLSGFSNFARIVVKGNAYCDTRNFLVQDRITINSQTVGSCYVNGASNYLKCETNSSGNVYYTNTPGFIEWNDYGSGKLLQAP
jgi:hypothetical protein